MSCEPMGFSARSTTIARRPLAQDSMTTTEVRKADETYVLGVWHNLVQILSSTSGPPSFKAFWMDFTPCSCVAYSRKLSRISLSASERCREEPCSKTVRGK